MIIINSSAYVIPEFRVEFGKIPPCMLPIGNRKLIELQVSKLKEFFNQEIYLTLPGLYLISSDESKMLDDLGVNLVVVPEGLSLSESLLYTVNTVDNVSENLILLHGDTYIYDLPIDSNVISVNPNFQDYSWYTEAIDETILAWCGFFNFASKREFIKSLAVAQGSFISAVLDYDHRVKLSRLVSNNWLDLGHVNTYFSSRTLLTTQRSFNDLAIKDGIVYKSGDLPEKILAEASWFTNIPTYLKKYTPQLIDSGYSDGKYFYELEYLPAIPLNEVFVHGKNPISYWDRLFLLIKDFLLASRSCKSVVDSNEVKKSSIALYSVKTWSRVNDFTNKNLIDKDKILKFDDTPLGSLNSIVEICVEKTLDLPVLSCVMHGDLCWSNILFDSRSSSIKVIDPRGIDQDGNITIYGDQKYDLAKITHSVIGLYDYIISGRYNCPSNSWYECNILFPVDERLADIQNKFLNSDLCPELSVKEIMPLTILLFLSMLPLHSDRPDRQYAMYVNALRLYKEFMYREELI